MADSFEVDYIHCKEEGCNAKFKNHLWGSIQGGEGWFVKKNGDAWCPDHLPKWVAKWREKQAQNSG